MTVIDKRCFTCAAFDENADNDRLTFKLVHFCRLNPPVATMTKQGIYQDVLPRVDSDDYCMQWRPNKWHEDYIEEDFEK